MSEEWREHRTSQWWRLLPDAPHNDALKDDRGVQYPPSMVATWNGQGCCVHLYGYCNGDMPDEADPDDVEYMHICDLDDFIEKLQELRAAMNWVRPSWDIR